MPDVPVLYVLAGQERVDALLYAYADWRRGQDDQGGLGYGESILGQLSRLANRAKGIDLPVAPIVEYPDDLMMLVGQCIEALPSKTRRIVREHYLGTTWWTTDQKARRCKVSRRTYFRHLTEGRERIEAMVSWDKVLVA